MTAGSVVVEGKIQPDGTLELNEKVDLPVGPVHVTIQRVAEPTDADRFWKMMKSIWDTQRRTGRIPRTQEQIDAEIAAFRNESEEEMQALKRLQEECRRAKEQGRPTNEPSH
jgi:hypothetical protein